MTGERDLTRLLRGMAPELDPRDWGFACLAPGAAPVRVEGLFARIAEDEGETLVAPLAALVAAGIAAEGPWARITLRVHSALEAVGLTAAVAGALAERGISANVIAAVHHDHIFVQAGRAAEAMAALEALSRG